MTLAEQMTLKLDDVITHISPANLIPNPYQPKSREDVPDETAAEFGASFERSGLIHFPVVRRARDDSGFHGFYEVGDGWLRRAGYLYNWKQKGLEEYSRLPCIVRELTDQQMADLTLEANLQRRDFNPIELAWLYKKYLDDFGVTQEEFAAGRGISQEEVSNTIRLLELPDDIQQRIISHEISKTHGRELLRLKDFPEKQQSTFKTCIKQGLSVDALDSQIATELYRGSRNLNPKAQSYEKPPKFDISGCEGCAHAEKLAGYGGVKKELRCLDPECWEGKQAEAQAAEIEKAKAELAKQGIERLYKPNEITYDQYNQLWHDFLEANPECKECAHRAGIMSAYDSSISIVCIDTECWEKKRKQQNEARNREHEKESEAKDQRVASAIANLNDMKLGLVEIFMMITDDDITDMVEILEIDWSPEDEEADSNEDRLGNAVRGRLLELSIEAIIRLMLRLMLGSWHYGRDDISIVERLEASAAPSPVDELKAIRPSPEAELIHTVPIEKWPDKEEIKAQAEIEIEAEKERQARETKFTKSVRCHGCGEKKTMEFRLAEGDTSEHHWKAECPKCQAINFVKNARWDNMLGLKKEEEKEGSD